MAFEFEEFFQAACGDFEPPRLVEVGRAFHRGKMVTTGYVWSSGRVWATAGEGWTKIQRPLGKGLRLDVGALRALGAVCQYWARYRDGWSAFYTSTAGYPAGFGAGRYYQAPGKGGERVKVGRVGPGGERGESFRGRDEFVPLMPRELGHRAQVVAEIWRRGERFGPGEGSLVGVKCQLGPELAAELRRRDMRIRGRAGEVVLEEGEEQFLAELLAVVG